MADLAALQKRVREATGPDRELDYDLWAEVDQHGRNCVSETQHLLMPWPEWRNIHWKDPPRSTYGEPDNHQAYTGLIDAAVALVERVLPGWSWGVDHLAGEPVRAHVGPPLGEGENEYVAQIWNERPGKTPPLALLSALLSALIAQEPGHG